MSNIFYLRNGGGTITVPPLFILRQKTKRSEFYKNYTVFTDFISILILRQNYSIYFYVNDFILIITVFFSYYKRFFYSGKNTTHYRYTFWKINP